MIALVIFSSCQKSDSNLDSAKMSDAELIEAIKNASNKQNIDVAELPSASRSTLDKYYADDIVDAAKLAPELGYEVDLREGSGPRVAAYIYAYFDLGGRELKDDDGKSNKEDGDEGDWEDKDKNECFELVLPVTFIMPDRTEITVTSKDDWGLIKAWYVAHPDMKERPALQFPVDVVFEDGTMLTVNSNEEMKRLHEQCEGDEGGKKRCFEFDYPVAFELPNGGTVTINNDEEMRAAKMEWKENGIRPALVFPVDIVMGDKAITVNNHEELLRIKKSCEGENGHHGDKRRCFHLIFPVTFELPGGSTVTIKNFEEMKAAKMEWKEAGIRPALQFPVDIKWKDGTVETINSAEEMRAARKKCGDGQWDKERCFMLVYPVTYILADGTEITFRKKEDREAMAAIKVWYERHPDVAKKPTLKYPVDIKYKDGTVVTINSKEEMKEAWEACKERE